MRSRLLWTTGFALIVFLTPARSHAARIPCPPFPAQTSRMAQQVYQRVSRGPLSRTSITNRITVGARNLYAEYPNADRVVVNMALLSMVCQVVSASNLSPRASLDLLARYQRQTLSNPRGLRAGSPPVRRPQILERTVIRREIIRQPAPEDFVTAEEARARPDCIPFRVDRSEPAYGERDRYIYLAAAQRLVAAYGAISLEGHVFEPVAETGELMSQEYAIDFSSRRASAVRLLLESLGISGQVIFTVGYGRTQEIQPIGSLYCSVIIRPYREVRDD